LINNEKPDFIQLVGVENNCLWRFFRGTKDAPLSEPLIIFDLTHTTEKAHFNLFTGVKDVF
jgi:hypothetical protein